MKSKSKIGMKEYLGVGDDFSSTLADLNTNDDEKQAHRNTDKNERTLSLIERNRAGCVVFAGVVHEIVPTGVFGDRLRFPRGLQFQKRGFKGQVV